jgi:hypothetical protein
MSFVFVGIGRAPAFRICRVHKRAHAPHTTLARFLEVPYNIVAVVYGHGWCESR